METFVPEICHEPTRPSPEELIGIERSIMCGERPIGIYNDKERWAEAALFVDREFIAVEALRGRKTGFERILGHIEWDGYLRAKFTCIEYGDKPARPHFFGEIHLRFLEFQAPHAAGRYAYGGYRAVHKGSNGEILPVQYSELQRKQIQSNPLLDFRVAEDNPNAGFLYYQYRNSEEHEATITEVCDWYNNTRKSRYMDPFTRAALLERKLIERHAYAYGICGRVARMAMNWSLMIDGESPSAIFNFNDDILVSEEQWIEQVKQGSERYFNMQSIARSYYQVDPIDFYGLRTHVAAYRHLESHEEPPKLEPGNQHNRAWCEDFLARLQEVQGIPFQSTPVYEFKIIDGQKTIIQKPVTAIE